MRNSRESRNRGVARNLFWRRTKEGVPFPAGEPGWGKSPQKPEKHAEHSIECHKFCSV